MIKVLANLQAPSKVNLVWQTKYRKEHFVIQDIVKRFIGAYKKDRTWRVNIDDLQVLIERLKNIEGQTVHIDVKIYKTMYSYFDKKDEILELRNKLDGIDSGIEFVGNFAPLPFQHVGIEFAYQVKNCIIADKVGLGKTIQGFSAAYKMFLERDADKCIIILPSSLIVKWGRDIEKFLGVKTFRLEGTPKQRKENFRKWMNRYGKNDFFCTVSYDTIKRDYKKYLCDYTDKKFIILMDEIQKIKNITTKRSQCCKYIGNMDLCIARIGLSATYIETGLQDLFGVMFVIDENVFGNNIMNFQVNFLVLDYMGKIVDYKNLDVATNYMEYKAVRRNKEMVKDQLKAHLPKVNDNTLWFEMDKKQKQVNVDILNKVVKDMGDMERQEKINMSGAMTEIGYLRQAAISAELIDGTFQNSAKIDALLEILPEIIEDHKVMIFCFYTKFIDIMERELQNIGIKTIAMHGKREEGHSKNRQSWVDKFEKSDVPVLLTSDILAEGVDLPFATYVINVDILWNPAKMTQRCGRIDRLNQTADNIYVLNLWCKDSIEEQMYEVLYKRQQVADQVIDGGNIEKRFKKLSFNDIKKMLRNLGGKI